MQPLIKTTMTFSPGFHIRLKMAAEKEGKPMAQLVEEKLAPVLDEQNKQRLKNIYAGLFAMEGMCKDPITDASITIDDVLYGSGSNRGGA